MDFDRAIGLIRSCGADQPFELKYLPHDIGFPRGRILSYRLPSGNVVQIYGEPREGGEVVWSIGVISFHLSEWNWQTREEMRKMMIGKGGKMVDEFDLRPESHATMPSS